MRRDFLQQLFGDPSVEERLMQPAHIDELISRIFEEADQQEAGLLKANKKPLADALKSVGVNAAVEAFPQWCEIRFDNEADYRAACASIFTPDAMHDLAQAGWVAAKSGDEGMANEAPDFKIGFFEVSVAGEDASDTEKAPDLEKVIKDGRSAATKEQDRDDDELNPVENPDDEMGGKAEGVGKPKDGADPKGKPKGSYESAAAIASDLLETTMASAIPAPVEAPLGTARRDTRNRKRMDALRRRHSGKSKP
jgi:hypothetical protein